MSRRSLPSVSGGTLAALLLAAIIVAGGLFIRAEYHRGPALEISLPSSPGIMGEVYVGGAVASPGIYPLLAGDTLADIVRAAGGTTGGADLNQVRVIVPASGAGELPQRVDINRAGAWLLEALPGVGEATARAIIDYRRQHGPFRDTRELLKVPGIGPATYEAIEKLVTVAD